MQRITREDLERLIGQLKTNAQALESQASGVAAPWHKKRLLESFNALCVEVSKLESQLAGMQL